MGANRDPAGRRLLVLGAGPAQLGLLRAARARGLFVIACDRDAGAPGFEYADRRALVSSEDEPAIERLARAEDVEALISPGADWPVAIAARVAERLALPHPLAPDVAATAVSKLRQRSRFDENGIPQPRWQLVSAPEDVELAPPCVVKPPDRQGQRGLTAVWDQREIPAAVGHALTESRSGVALVEELVEGPEVTVNAFSVDGQFHPLTVTDRLTADPPAFGVALAHSWPSEVATEAVVEAARRAAEAIGIENGPTYTQVRIAADGPRVMELAVRLGGGHDAELCEAALGVDLNGLALAAAFGDLVPAGHVQGSGTEAGPEGTSSALTAASESRLKSTSSVPQGHGPGSDPSTRPGGACVRFLVAPAGELAAVGGLEQALEVEGVMDARVYRGSGWRFGPLRTGGDRAGFVLARGDSRDDALARADEAANYIRFQIVDAEALV